MNKCRPVFCVRTQSLELTFVQAAMLWAIYSAGGGCFGQRHIDHALRAIAAWRNISWRNDRNRVFNSGSGKLNQRALCEELQRLGLARFDGKHSEHKFYAQITQAGCHIAQAVVLLYGSPLSVDEYAIFTAPQAPDDVDIDSTDLVENTPEPEQAAAGVAKDSQETIDRTRREVLPRLSPSEAALMAREV